MPGETDEIRHRKNAAEWVMWVVLQPVALVLRLFERGRRR